LRFARRHAPGRRGRAIESSGSPGAGLATILVEHDKWVVDVERLARPAYETVSSSS